MLRTSRSKFDGDKIRFTFGSLLCCRGWVRIRGERKGVSKVRGEEKGKG
jgi:hypothetical protein